MPDCTDCHKPIESIVMDSPDGPLCLDCFRAWKGMKPEERIDQRPGFSHALGCQFNGIPALACVCGLPNAPKP